MKRFQSSIFVIITVLAAFLQGPSVHGATYPLHAFEDYASTRMKKMELIGVVTSKGHMVDGQNRRKMLDYDTREMILSAKLYEDAGVRIGDEIFIIQKDPDHERYKSGLVVGKAEVISVFQTEFQGWMIKAKGNLSMVAKGHFIARLDFGAQRLLALEYSRKGDRYYNLQEYAKAYDWYKQSLDLDPDRPETYMKLYRLMKMQDMDRKAYIYIRQAWNLKAKFEDPNDYLILPGMYIGEAMEEVERMIAEGKITGSRQQFRMKQYLAMLDEIRQYKSKIIWIKPYLSPPVLRMLEKKGIPHALFQYQFGVLMEKIYNIMTGRDGTKRPAYTQVLEWLTRAERSILLSEIILPYRKNPFEDPQKSWELAYLKASIYHFELAHELNRLDTRAAYHIIMLAEHQIQEGVLQKQREMYVSYIQHYSREYMRVPDNADRAAKVRQISNMRSQR